MKGAWSNTRKMIKKMIPENLKFEFDGVHGLAQINLWECIP